MKWIMPALEILLQLLDVCDFRDWHARKLPRKAYRKLPCRRFVPATSAKLDAGTRRWAVVPTTGTFMYPEFEASVVRGWYATVGESADDSLLPIAITIESHYSPVRGYLASGGVET